MECNEETGILAVHEYISTDRNLRHGVKVGPGPQDPGPRDPGTRDPPQSLKMGPPHFSLMNSFFSEYFIVLFYLFIFVSFLNKIQKNINCE